MDGDLAPLDQLAPLCRQHGARLILDDAHGTGVLGASGAGTAEHFGLAGQVDVTMGTFSKVFGAVGGFLSGAGPLVEYLRFFARSYMFSASLPPAVAAAVLAGLDVLAAEPERRRLLRTNVDYAVQGLRALGFNVATPSAIIALRVPLHMDLRRAAHRFHELGVFVNAVEYPAVPRREQRFRISLMATHTRADLDRLLESVATVWKEEHQGVAHE
jgi:glycine C-acetyltransferase